MRRIVGSFVLGVGMFALACGGGGDSSSNEAFSVPTGAVQIGSAELYLEGGEPVEGLPTPSSSSTAPTITSITANVIDTYTLEVTIHVEGEETVATVYLDFGALGLFKVQPYERGGGGCTENRTHGHEFECHAACVQACSCLVCPDGDVQADLRSHCSDVCSSFHATGEFEYSFDGIESNFAYWYYNGDPTDVEMYPRAPPECSTAACPLPRDGGGGGGGGSGPGTRVQGPSFKFAAPAFSFGTETFMFSAQVETGGSAPEASQKSAPADLNTCMQNDDRICR